MYARIPSPALVLGAIASVQVGNGIAQGIFVHVGPGGAGLLRLAMATLILLALFRPRVRGRSRAELSAAATLGVILAAMNLTFYHAIQHVPLGIAVTVEFIGPMAVAVAGSRRPRDLLWVLLAALGILALAHGGHHGTRVLGLVLAAVAGVLWGLYILAQARLGSHGGDSAALGLAMVVATVVALPDGLIEGGSRLLSGHVLLVSLAVGLLSSALPYSFELEALKRIATHVFGVLMSLEPGMAALAGLVLLGQGLGTRDVIGLVLVSSASLGTSLTARSRVREVSDPGRVT